MPSENQIQSLLKKYVLNQCTKQEVDEVVTYIQGIKESSQLPSVEDVLDLLDEKPILNDAVANRVEKAIFKDVQKDKRTVLNKKSIWKYAVASVVFIGLIATSYVFQTNKISNDLQ